MLQHMAIVPYLNLSVNYVNLESTLNVSQNDCNV